jgi:ABC-2 type transport system permease protein
MNILRILAIVLRQIYLYRSSVSRVFPLFIWVAVDIILWGFLTRYLNTLATATFNFVPALLGAVVLWDFFIRIMHGVSMAFLEDVWSRNFLNLFSTPLSVGEYLAGLVAASIVTSLVSVAVMLVLAFAVFGLPVTMYGLAAFPFLMVLFLFGVALGIAACALVLRLGPSAEWFTWPIPAVVSPFVGVFYPISVLPHWMQVVARGMPPSYVFDSLRAIVNGGEADWTALFFGIGLACVYVLLACLFFIAMYKHAVRTGLFARYSAESLN